MSEVSVILLIFFRILIFAIFARSLLSWFPIDRNGPVFQFLDAVTDPILVPLRKVIPNVGMLDLTPMIAVIVLYAISQAIAEAL